MNSLPPKTHSLLAAEFIDPDEVGTSEYRAIYDAVTDALADISDPDEQLEHAVAMLEEFKRMADSILRVLSPVLTRCANCDTVRPITQVVALSDVDSLHDRLDPGAEVPAGECPDRDCGSLVYLTQKGLS